MLRRIVLGFGFAAAVLIGADRASGGSIYMDTDRFGYTGTITQYGSLADAESGTNPLGSFSVGQRDLSIGFVDNAPDVSDNFFQTLTAWYYSVTGPHPGGGNPSNQNEGFVQISDDGHTTVTSFSAAFTDSALTTYHLQVSGGNANDANASARLGYQGSNSYDPSVTAGTFLTYNLDATFSNLNPATFNTYENIYESNGDPAGVAVSGTFNGIFQNPNSPFVGFYTFNFNLNNTSWAYDNRDGLSDPSFMPSFYASDVAVPEPGSLVLASIGTGCGLIVAACRARRLPATG